MPSEPLFSILKRRHGKMLPSKMGLVALKSIEGTIEKGGLRLNLNSAGSLCSRFATSAPVYTYLCMQRVPGSITELCHVLYISLLIFHAN